MAFARHRHIPLTLLAVITVLLASLTGTVARAEDPVPVATPFVESITPASASTQGGGTAVVRGTNQPLGCDTGRQAAPAGGCQPVRRAGIHRRDPDRLHRQGAGDAQSQPRQADLAGARDPITVRSEGDRDPVGTNRTKLARAANRRAAITLP